MTCDCGGHAETVVPEPLCNGCARAFYRGVTILARAARRERAHACHPDVAAAGEAMLKRAHAEWHAAARRHEFAIVKPLPLPPDQRPTLEQIFAFAVQVNALKAEWHSKHAPVYRYRESA